ncbi:MAG: GAF domain-containing sensor histidine kinase [Chloroflexota bacterium]
MNIESETSTQLHGFGLALARLGWFAILGLSLGLFAVNVAWKLPLLPWDEPFDYAVSIFIPQAPSQLVSAYVLALHYTSPLIFFLTAVFMFWRKSQDWMVVLVSAILLIMPLPAELSWDPDILVVKPVPVTLLVSIKNYFVLPAASSVYLLYYLIPNGHFAPRWTRWAAVISITLGLFLPALIHLSLSEEKPSFLLGQILQDWGLPIGIFQASLWTLAVGVQLHRYRRVYSLGQRQQTRLVVFGLAVQLIWVWVDVVAFVPAVTRLTLKPALYFALTRTHLIQLLYPFIPLTMAISIYRYHLWNINVTNRTLVYGVLAGFSGLLYVLIVGGLVALVQVKGNLLVTIPMTGLVAILTQLVLGRLRRVVSRLLYGERDDPLALLMRLSQRLEATLPAETVLPTIVKTVGRALKLPYVAIALQEGGTYQVVAEYKWPALHSATLEKMSEVFPLQYQGETIGRLIVMPHTPGEGFTPADRLLLENIAHQASAAAHDVRLTAELQRSRERLVTAREEERRRLHRDLHDGLGPTLAAQTLKVGSARHLLLRDPAAADALLAELEADITVALADVRRLVYNLRPPALDELGLVTAIRDCAARYGSGAGQPDRLPGVQITVVLPERLPLLPAAVEVAAYRIVQEALTNVVRHAHARTCRVQLWLDDGLHLLVQDDGVGLSPDHPAGVGLASMRERAEELGGRLIVRRAAGGGLYLRADLPLPKED